ncbi:MAG TPA: hypothetical protein VKP88_04995 [Candidatus Paceibacterota bacterium]|nr:hypothetical protein [Candidatus Paceibacterota bacterium]
MWSQFLGWIYRLTKRTRVRTVRHAFSLGTVALAAMVATALLSDTDSYVKLVTTEQVVEAGDQFTVAVYVGAPEAVNAIDIAVRFPTAVVDVDGVDVGRSVISLWTQDPYVEDDAVILRGGTFRRGFIGEHLVAEINFTATQSGRAEFDITNRTLLSGDGTGDALSDVQAESVAVVALREDGTVEADVGITFVTDIDGNGSVSLQDIELFMTAWRSERWIYDFNNDRKMNFTDFAILLADSFFN